PTLLVLLRDLTILPVESQVLLPPQRFNGLTPLVLEYPMRSATTSSRPQKQHHGLTPTQTSRPRTHKSAGDFSMRCTNFMSTSSIGDPRESISPKSLRYCTSNTPQPSQ